MKGVKLTLLEAGYCTHPEAMVFRGGSLKSRRFPSRVALIEHPTRGPMLFDAGYSMSFYEETSKFPARFYAMTTPVFVEEEKTASGMLASMGVAANDIRTIVVSHFHADHIGGLKDFPKAEFVYQKHGFDVVKDLRGFGAVKAGFLPGLVPSDFEARGRPTTPADYGEGVIDLGPFRTGFDLCGDGSLVLVPLEGHAAGQLGLLVRTESQGEIFLVADACWLERAFRECVPPSVLTGLIQYDFKTYKTTLERLHALWRERPDVTIVPCHGHDPLPNVA